MSDTEPTNSGGGGGDDELTLPRATVQKLISGERDVDRADDVRRFSSADHFFSAIRIPPIGNVRC